MVKQKSQAEIAAEIVHLKLQVKECEDFVSELGKVRRPWKNLNKKTRETFKESTFYETLDKTLRRSDVLADQVYVLVGKVRKQCAGFKKRQNDLEKELQSFKSSQAAERNQRNPRQSK